jgi:DNA-binding transcriptional LysR family regulator
MILRGAAELAVVTLAPASETSLVSLPVWQDPLDIMVARDHPLLTRGTSLDLAALSEHTAILPGLNTFTGQIVKALFDAHNLPLKVSMATNYLETIRMMASVGLGWTILPRSMAEASLATLTIDGIVVQRTLGVVYHRGRSLSRAARAFLEAVQAQRN